LTSRVRSEFRGERTLTQQTTLDVTGYARLWRLTWWTQHVAWPLATFGAGVILLATVWHALGQLDDQEKYFINNISSQSQSTEAEREYRREVFVAVFRLARDGLGPGLPWVATLAAAFLFELVVYLRGCGRFRLPLLSWSLVGFIVTAVVTFLGVEYAEKALLDYGYAEKRAQEGEGLVWGPVNAQTLYYLTLGVFALLAWFVSLVLLALRGIAILLLWRHRLRPDLVRTQRMTRSLGVNLTIPQFTWPRPSLAGFAAHACIFAGVGNPSLLVPRMDR
jgi:hypothetical protein